MRQFGVAHEIFKTLFMSDHDLLIFFNMSEQFLAPGGLSAECVQVSVMQAWLHWKQTQEASQAYQGRMTSW